MVDISLKSPTKRSATACTTLIFSHAQTYTSLETATLQKGDALAVARIAGIQATKLTPTLIPLAHPSLAITGVEVNIEILPPTRADAELNYQAPGKRSYTHGAARIEATVKCEGKTGVEMEALTAANVAGLALYDMLKGTDKAMELIGGRVIRKTGGKSGGWYWDEGKGQIVRDGGPGVANATGGE